MRFNLFDHPIVAMASDYYSPALSWASHIPFAFLSMELLKPGVFVELGTYNGTSYCGFCQAVEHLKLPTRCFAVDTWKGDQHTGSYSRGVLDSLRSHHDPRYSSFSKLMQMTFDQALSHFADGSIDLLHIDGAHDFESVRHDYQSWRPKMSDRGVVLFHDTSEKSAGFGVYRLWEELASQYPSFEFQHGHGLGVLGVGKKLPPPFLEFLQEARFNPQGVRDAFAVLGRANEADCEHLVVGYWAFQLQGEINRYKREIGESVDPKSEDLHAALENTLKFTNDVFNQAGAMIKNMIDTRKTAAAGNK